MRITTAEQQNANAISVTLTFLGIVEFVAAIKCMIRVFHNVYAHNSSTSAMMDYAFVFQITFCSKANVSEHAHQAM